MRATEYRTPISVLVVVYTDDDQTLLLRRSKPFDFWQSITGSLHGEEDHAETARRELLEETGLSDAGVLQYSGISRQFAIDSRWRYKFAPGVVENVEFEWHYRLPAPIDVVISDEHSEYAWLPIREAVQRVWSWTNRDALTRLIQ